MRQFVVTVVIAILGTACCAQDYSIFKIEASPVPFGAEDQQQCLISFETSEPTRGSVFINDASLNVIRAFHDEDFQLRHDYVWDLRDQEGRSVPPGVYTYRIQTENEAGVPGAYDLTLRTGATDAMAYWPKWNPVSDQVCFSLNENSLARVRVGLRNGPLIGTVANWVPMLKGERCVPWDAPDAHLSANGEVDTNLLFDVSAIALPENAIFVDDPSGAMLPGYADARWIEGALTYNKNLDPKAYQLAREIVGSRDVVNDDILIVAGEPLDEEGTLLLDGPKSITVRVPPLELHGQPGAFYEAVYYVDGEFVGESPVENVAAEIEIAPEMLSGQRGVLVVNIIYGSKAVGSRILQLRKE